MAIVENLVTLLMHTLVPEKMNRRPVQPAAANTNLADVPTLMIGIAVLVSVDVVLFIGTNVDVLRKHIFMPPMVALATVSTPHVYVIPITGGTAVLVSVNPVVLWVTCTTVRILRIRILTMLPAQIAAVSTNLVFV
jgi:hypothetical protein